MHYEVPGELHQRAKIAAVLTERSLKQLLIDALTAEVERVESEREAR